MITDRNGQILAISLPTVAVFADPRQIIDPADAAHRLKQALPRLDEARRASGCRQPTGSSSGWSVRSRRARNWRSMRSAFLGSISSRPSSGITRWAAPPAQVLGGTDVDEHGVAGVEKFFDKRLFSDHFAAEAVDRCARAGGGARRIVQGDGRIPGHRRLRHRDGREHGRGAGDGQPARLRHQRLPHRARRRSLQPRGDRHVRAGQHVQAADRVDGAGLWHCAHLGRVRRLAPDPHRPLHHHRLRGQAPLVVSAGGACLFLEPRRGAYRR